MSLLLDLLVAPRAIRANLPFREAPFTHPPSTLGAAVKRFRGVDVTSIIVLHCALQCVLVHIKRDRVAALGGVRFDARDAVHRCVTARRLAPPTATFTVPFAPFLARTLPIAATPALALAWHVLVGLRRSGDG